MTERKIVSFHLDEENHWMAKLDCGHTQHVRHSPPWQNRPWVITEAGRGSKLGVILDCLKCNRKEPIIDPKFDSTRDNK